MNKIALSINFCADDWTAKRVIIASNVLRLYSYVMVGGEIKSRTITVLKYSSLAHMTEFYRWAVCVIQIW